MGWSINKNSLFSHASITHDTPELLFGLPSPHHRRERDRLWVTLSNDSLSLMQLLDVDVDMLKGEKNEDENVTDFTPGSIYAIGREKIEGVEFGDIYFRIYGVVREYKGVDLNSVIVKEVVIDEEGCGCFKVKGRLRAKIQLEEESSLFHHLCAKCLALNIHQVSNFGQ